MKSAILAGLVLALALPALSACGGGADPVAEAAPEGFPGVSVTKARLVLPAVKGNPAALYFDIAYSGDDIAMIRGVHVAGAKSAMMHATVESQGVTYMEELLQVKLEKGQSKSFAPGGDHVMAMEPDETLQAGGKTEVTLTFLGGDKYSFSADLRAPGDAD